MERLSVREAAQMAKKTAAEVALLTLDERNQVISAIAESLEAHISEILAANAKDLENMGNHPMRDRLLLTEERILAIASATRDVVQLPDPLDVKFDETWTRPNGLKITKHRVPFGLIGMIYEARPNVTVDAAVLCLKSGNACLLRGGSDAIESNRVLTTLMQDVLRKQNLPEAAISLIEDTSRDSATEMMHLKGILDLLIPRGGAGLIQSVVEHATVPVIETGSGICHVYVDETADLDKAFDILINSKTQRPSVCNSAETLVVHEAVAAAFLPRLENQGIELRGDATAQKIISCQLASDEDFHTEYNALILNIKVVSNLTEAIAFINNHSTHHTECIVSSDETHIEDFQRRIDSAVIVANASTRFTDGFEFGFGAEIGISTQKLHARGPMGLAEMTTYKYLIQGEGQVRA
ncbi:MAG: glutamate-5-semialdehyde dehydrogenase [Streptococcaceae bacterium]|nr:glutamate-5-semialdehyde dehydrogenase [Streptococcaceae bacterium]